MREQELLAKLEPTQPYVEPTLETQVPRDIDVQSKIDLYSQLGVDMNLLNDKDTTSKVGDVYEWARSVKPDADTLGITMMVQEIMAKIGRTDKTMLETIWDYIQIDRQMRILNERKRMMFKE